MKIRLAVLLAFLSCTFSGLAGTVAAWQWDAFGQSSVPANLTNAISVAASGNHSLALKSNGTVIGWGDNAYGQSTSPVGLTNAMAIAAGAYHSLALKVDGTVVGWGLNTGSLFGNNQATPPVGLSNVVAIGAGQYFSLAVKRDGTVVGWGRPADGVMTIPPGLLSVVAVAGGEYHMLGLKSDGTVVGWGGNPHGEASAPSDLTNAVAIAAGEYHSLALKSDGTVVVWGSQTDVPPGLSNVVAITAGWGHNMALKRDGTVTVWGNNGEGELNVPAGLQNVSGIAAGWYHNLALQNSTSPSFVRQPIGTTVFDGTRVLLNAGVTGNQPMSFQWRFNGTNLPGATSDTLLLSGVNTNNSGTYDLTVVSPSGSITSSDAILTVIQSPPTIVSQPTNQLRSAGLNALFAAVVVGSEPMTYQWRYNGSNIVGGTNMSLNLSTLTLADEGSYDLVASNPHGVVISEVAYLNVVDLAESVGATNLTWTTGGDASWFAQTNVFHTGPTAAQSGSIGDNQQSTLQATVNGPGTLKFWWKVSSESTGDYLSFSLNGGEISRLSAEADWQPQTVYLPSGPNTLTWTYSKDAFPYGGNNIAWIDDVEFTPGGTSPQLSLSPSNQLVPLGSSVALLASAFGTPPLQYQWRFNQSDIAGQTNASLSLTNLQFSNEGVYDVVVGNDFGTAISSNAFVNVVDLAEALGYTNLTWSTGGNRPWFVQTVNTHDGVAALQSGAIINNQQSTLQTVVNGPGSVTFWWKVSSQTNGDILKLTANGIEQARISGNVNWQQQTCYVGQGTQTLQWAYIKDASGTSGSDAGWLDEVVFTPGETVAFIAAGPTNQMPVLGRSSAFNVVALGTPPLNYQWFFNGTSIPGATNASLLFTNSDYNLQGNYNVAISNLYGTVTSDIASLKISPLFAWGAGATNLPSFPTNGQSTIPFGLDNVAKIAAGGYHNLVLKNDGRVVAWGANTQTQTNVPSTATNVMAVAAGDFHNLALRSNGTVVAWGGSSFAQSSVPPAATNILSVAGGGFHSLALKSNGTVIAWGAGASVGSSPHFGQAIVPAGLSNVVAISAGGFHSLALKSDGTITAWGWNAHGQTNVPASLTNVVAIAAGASNSLALKSDGTVVAWGNNNFGQTNVPAGLANVVAIAAGQNHCLALKKDGTLVAWGLNSYGQTNVPSELKNVVAIAAGGLHNLVRLNDGSPTILKQPLSQSAYDSFTANLSVTAIGVQPLFYQWQFNGTNIDGATNQTLSFPNLTFANVGNYCVQISNSIGSTISSNATLLVLSPLPFFTSQPTNQNAIIKSNVTLSALAASPVPISYQWRFNGADIFNATNTALNLTNLQLTNSGNYSVFASNSFGVVTTSNAFLNVIDLAGSLNTTGLVWTTSGNFLWFPQTTTTHDGIAAASSGAVTFAQQATLQTTVVGPGTLTFWWRVSVNFGPNNLSFSIDGTSQGLSPSTIWQQQTVYIAAGTHTLQWNLSNNSGSSVTGYLDQVSFFPGTTPALIVNPPTSQSLPAGTNLTFLVGVGGTPTLSYQWQFNGSNIAGATRASLTLNNIQAANSGDYTFFVTNSYGATNVTASLIVNPSAPSILIQPTNQLAVVNGNCGFAVSARGTDPLSYQWQFNGANLPGETNPSLNIINVQTNKIGNYSVVVSNANGSITSSAATFTFVPTLLIGWGDNFFGQASTPLTVSNVSIFRGGWDYTVALNGNGSIFSWGFPESAITPVPTNVVDLAAGTFGYWALQANGIVGGAGVPAGLTNVIQISAGSSFNIALRQDHTVTGWGSSSADQTNIPPSLTNVVAVASSQSHHLALKNDETVVNWGSTVFGQLNMPAGLSNVVAISAGWYHSLALKQDGTVIAWGSNFSGETNVPPGLSNVVAIAAGNDQSMALKADGTVVVWGDNFDGQGIIPISVTNVVAIDSGSSHFLALVNDGSPYITRSPYSQKALPGSTVSLNVAAMGLSPLSYQWQFNGSDIMGATNASFTLNSVIPANEGQYRCVVTNFLGIVQSSPAALNVIRTAPIFNLVSQHFGEGFRLRLSGLSGNGPIVIFASTNLVDWQPVYTNSATFGSFEYIDQSATNRPVQFYKAMEK